MSQVLPGLRHLLPALYSERDRRAGHPTDRVRNVRRAVVAHASSAARRPARRVTATTAAAGTPAAATNAVLASSSFA